MLATNRIAIAPPAADVSVEAWVEAHGDFVFRTLGRFGVGDADLADMSQEVFIVALRRAGRSVPEDAQRPWLYGIARRVAAAYRRRAHRRYETPDESAGESEPSLGPSPEEAALQREAETLLARILEKMTLDQRAVFTMFEIEGMTGAEIGEAIGAPVPTVFTRLRRARGVFEREAARLQGGGSR